MIILANTADLIQIALAAPVTTNQLEVYASYRDVTTTAYTPGRSYALSNNVADVTVVPAPAAATQRVIDLLNVFNRDTVSATLTIKFEDSGTERILWKGTLATGERVEYADGSGFRSFTADGSVKGVGTTGAAGANGGGTVLGSGTSTVDFGAGSLDASTTVVGQPAILAGSLVYCWIKPADTPEHSADEHLAEAIRVLATSVVAGVGFTLRAFASSDLISSPIYQRAARFSGIGTDPGPGQAARQEPISGGKTPLLSGRFSVGWLYTQ